MPIFIYVYWQWHRPTSWLRFSSRSISFECSAHESVADREEVEVWNPCIAINHHLSVCSSSSFLVYLNSGPAAAVQEQRQRHWVQPGSVGWGKRLPVLRRYPLPTTRTSQLSRQQSAASGRISASKSKLGVCQCCPKFRKNIIGLIAG